MVDEEQNGRLLSMVVRAACPARGGESQSFVANIEFNKFVRDSSSVDLADSVNRSCIGWHRDTHCRISMLLRGEGNALTMYSVSTNYIKNFCVFLTVRLEGFLTLLDIIEKIFNLVND